MGRKNIKIESESGSSDTFNQYTIKWDQYKVNFSLLVEGGKFYGSYRKSRITNNEDGESIMVYAIDTWVQYKDRTYVVETIRYQDKDPRNNIRSLNADICAAVNKWLYFKCKGTLKSVEELQHRSDKPLITIKHSATLDQIIHRLKEFRNTALQYGGSRALIIEGDIEEEPQITIQTNLTTEAELLKGKVPPLFGADVILSSASRKLKGNQQVLEIGNNESVKGLLDQLRSTKDKAQQRKLRSTLRKLGFRGGLRNVKVGVSENED